MASSDEDDILANAPDEDEDLFGDEDEAAIDKPRALSDEDLDSGDDAGRDDRAPKDDVETYDQSGRDARVLEQTIFGHPVPKPANGELNTLRLPQFLGIEPVAYDADTFVPPTSDHHTTTKSANFSASAVAASTMRYRKNLTNDKFESNTIVYRWSDGSTTIAIGDQHYELQTKPVAPPVDSKTYLDVQDSHQYLASPSIAAQLLVTLGHFTNQYTVRPNKDIEDDALEKLQKNLAAATRGNHKGDDKGGPEVITNTQDPELQKRQAEIAEKERMRAQRRRETIAEKQSLPRGPPASRNLRMDDLDRRAATSGRKPKRGPRRPRDSYDSDDEPRGGGRGMNQDEYDMDDGFLASSGEELEEGAEDDDEEELLDDESERDKPKAKKRKVADVAEVSDADADAEADLDDEDAPAIPIPNDPVARGRKRNIIEDDDDE